MKRSDIEIMAPVGSYESLAAAIRAGADAVYFGVGKLNMRSASAANFTLDDLGRIVASARKAGVKTYLTVNTIVYEDEIADVHAVIDRAKKEGVDAVIASDMAAILYARRIGQEVHISTQSNISNSEAVRFYAQWADTVVLARELSLEQVAVEVSKLTLNTETASLKVGEKIQMVSAFAPANATDTVVVWTSKEPDIAAVDGKGVITGLKAGTTVVSGKVGNGYAEVTVTVTAGKFGTEGLLLSKEELTLVEREQFNMSYEVYPGLEVTKDEVAQPHLHGCSSLR